MTDKRSHIIRVWDIPTRAFHWLLVALIAFLWWSGENHKLEWHKLAGFGVAALLVFRLFWGFFGAGTARFSHFLRGPRAIWRYLRGRLDVIGHNPLGAWSVVALLSLTAIETYFGLFAIDEDGLESGPFAPMLSFDSARQSAHVHSLLFNWLLGLIGLHIAAIAFYTLSGTNLVGPMLTGRARVSDQAQEPHTGSIVALLIGLVLAGATFYLLWWYDNR